MVWLSGLLELFLHQVLLPRPCQWIGRFNIWAMASSLTIWMLFIVFEPKLPPSYVQLLNVVHGFDLFHPYPLGLGAKGIMCSIRNNYIWSYPRCASVSNTLSQRLACRRKLHRLLFWSCLLTYINHRLRPKLSTLIRLLWKQILLHRGGLFHERVDRRWQWFVYVQYHWVLKCQHSNWNWVSCRRSDYHGPWWSTTPRYESDVRWYNTN